MDPQILLFRRQYFQVFEPDFLAWPPKQLLREPAVQAWLYHNLFDHEQQANLPAIRYQWRVLKRLMSKIERAVEDPEQDVGSIQFKESLTLHFISLVKMLSDVRLASQEISDDLMNRLSSLMSSNLPSEEIAVQQKSFVTFSCLSPKSNLSTIPDPEPTITLLERRNLISGSRTTGFRTWEAALHLGSYLLCEENACLIRGKSVIELGVGTGFISILCAKHLGARHVTATDGDEGVVDVFGDNLLINGLDDDKHIHGHVLRWGSNIKGSWVEDDCAEWPYDVVLGADIVSVPHYLKRHTAYSGRAKQITQTYDTTTVKALVSTMRFLFELRPQVQVFIAGAVRNSETFEMFQRTCLKSGFAVDEIDFAPKPMREQVGLFYATAVPLRILSITCGDYL